MRRGHVMGVGGHRRAGELGVGAPAARAAAPGVLEDEERGGLADGHAAAVAVEGPARLGVEQLERIEAHEADARERVDAADQRHVDHAVADQVGAERDGGGARRRTPSPASRAGPRARSGRPARRRARAAGRSEGRARPGAGRPLRTSSQYHASASYMPPPTAPTRQAARRRSRAVELRVGERLGRRREGEPVGPRAPARRPERHRAPPPAPPRRCASGSPPSRWR